MKALLAAAAAALVLTSAGVASAAPKHYGHNSHGKVSIFERAAITRAKLKVAYVQRKARADGRVTPYERAQIRQAQAQLQYTIAKARRS